MNEMDNTAAPLQGQYNGGVSSIPGTQYNYGGPQQQPMMMAPGG